MYQMAAEQLMNPFVVAAATPMLNISRTETWKILTSDSQTSFLVLHLILNLQRIRKSLSVEDGQVDSLCVPNGSDGQSVWRTQ